ncbi:cytochrome b5 domain-containing protein [Alkaliphilus peptidifermentans]|uniref:Predicted heme/steroid binding protein n=1 Tax=Alkaliphilus peptidifermentans DSM 18978 TaxID=1120976 RepID=A0A1G5F2F2_9FIRM|nr:cytochrome b5 domain-containing protein [Alkaliphilus peptidifermentans]SCY33291.1 Predicted heme/steroid binding protein [Alkaliphilus peptidifermentans DSM 18978]
MKRKKITMLLIILLLLAFFVIGCKTETGPTSEEGLQEFTIEELAQYNGKNGMAAYVAVDGVVYDVTEISAWKDGQHNGFEAGKDLTDAIKNQSPHGVSKLRNVKKVGILIE